MATKVQLEEWWVSSRMSNQRWEAEDSGGDRIRVERFDDGGLIVSCLMEDTWERSEVTLDVGQATSLAQFILGSGWNGVDLGVDNGGKSYAFTADRGDPENPDK